jgi:hypothetical protein
MDRQPRGLQQAVNTLDSIATPCSVNTRIALRLPPRPGSDLPFWNIKQPVSSGVSRNVKSGGNRSLCPVAAGRFTSFYDAAPTEAQPGRRKRNGRDARATLLMVERENCSQHRGNDRDPSLRLRSGQASSG